MSQFLRFYRREENREILINVNSIWKIEVDYVVEGQIKGQFHKVPLARGINDADAVKHYRVFAGSEEIKVMSNPDDPVVKVLEEIYKNAIKN